MDFNTIKINGDQHGVIVQHVHFKLLAAAIIVAALLFCATLCLLYYWRPDHFEFYVTRSTGVIHNRSCIYFGKTRGYYTNQPEGRDCKRCGGRAVRRDR